MKVVKSKVVDDEGEEEIITIEDKIKLKIDKLKKEVKEMQFVRQEYINNANNLNVSIIGKTEAIKELTALLKTNL